MKTILKQNLRGLLIVPMMVLGMSAVAPVLSSAEVYAQDISQPSQSDLQNSGGLRDGVDSAATEELEQEVGLFDEGGIFQTIVNTLLFIIGAVAVIMLVYGGFRYVTSGGDSSAVTSAKNTILYAVIGIVVALLSWAILDFVLKALQG